MKNKFKIAIIGAMECEINTLRMLLENYKTNHFGKINIYEGNIGENEIIISQSGVGKVNAAINTQYIIDKYAPDMIINTGVAGGIGENLSVGDIVIGDKFYQHDFDATALGYAKGYMCTGINPSEPTTFYADKNLIEKFENEISNKLKDFKIHKGTIVTGDMFIANPDKKQELKSMFNAIAAEMEAAAIVQTANKNEIPCLVIRSISDLADCTSAKSIQEVEKIMAEFAAKTVEILLKCDCILN